MPAEEVFDAVAYQLGIFQAIASALDVQPNHVKPHGALYNRAARDPALAASIARAVRLVSAELILVGLAGSALLEAGVDAGLVVAAEAFADRAYEQDGLLRSRRLEGALLPTPEAAGQQALTIARDGRVRAFDGSEIEVRADTLCIHGDSVGAAEVAIAVRATLEAAGLTIAPMSGAR